MQILNKFDYEMVKRDELTLKTLLTYEKKNTIKNRIYLPVSM